jgi:hypothetical protein
VSVDKQYESRNKNRQVAGPFVTAQVLLKNTVFMCLWRLLSLFLSGDAANTLFEGPGANTEYACNFFAHESIHARFHEPISKSDAFSEASPTKIPPVLKGSTCSEQLFCCMITIVTEKNNFLKTECSALCVQPSPPTLGGHSCKRTDKVAGPFVTAQVM